MSSDAVLTILTSALVSSIVGVLLRIVFENRQQHRFDLEIEKNNHSYKLQLEKMKAEILFNSDVRHELFERRLRCYPRLTELAYRARNIAREVATGTCSAVLISEFQDRTNEFEEVLYTSRIDLEMDGGFVAAHTYKNLLKTFGRIASDLDISLQQDPMGNEAADTVQDLRGVYEKIEGLHKPLIDEMAAKSTALGARNSAQSE